MKEVKKLALHNNTPCNTYVYIENLTITHEDKTYPITNTYTNKKYVYFNLNNPQILYLSDRLSTSSLIESNSNLYFSDISTTSCTFFTNPCGSKLSNTNLINSLLIMIPFPFIFLIM